MVHTWVGSGGGFRGTLGHTRHCLRGTLLASVGIGMDAVHTWAVGKRLGGNLLGAGVG